MNVIASMQHERRRPDRRQITHILPWAPGNALIGVSQSLVYEGLHFFRPLCLGLGGYVDVSNLEVHLGHKLDSSNLGHDCKSIRVLPNVIDEWRISVKEYT